jgi:hypothetical protein
MHLFKNKKNKVNFKLNDAQRAFYIFSIIYFPVTVLFIENSRIAEIILAVLTLSLLSIGSLLIYTFWIELGDYIDKKYPIKNLLQKAIINAIFPLSMFKVFALVILKILPSTHTGTLCVLKDLILNLYNIFKPQQTLNLFILSTIGIILFISASEFVAKTFKNNKNK